MSWWMYIAAPLLGGLMVADWLYKLCRGHCTPHCDLTCVKPCDVTWEPYRDRMIVTCPRCQREITFHD